MRIALGLEYDGSSYHGWQSQKNGVTVQETLEQSLSKIANHSITVVVAGRTDAGVHATAQVVHFDTTAERPLYAWVRGGNANLPPQIRVRWATDVDESFHARFCAIERHYRYLIINRAIAPAILHQRVTCIRQPLDDQAMHRAAQCLVGEHDFSSFRASGCQSKSPVRCINAIRVTRRGGMLAIEVSANAFLHHMIRNIAGTLFTVGLAEQSEHWVAEVLTARDRTVAGITAPPDGLYLTGVCYPDRYAIPPASEPHWLW